DEALDMYEALLREVQGLPAEDRMQTEQEISELAEHVGLLDVIVSETGATVIIDGRERGTSPLTNPIRVTEGSRELRVGRTGFEPFEARVEVAGGQRAVRRAALIPLTRSGRLRVVEQRGARARVVVDRVEMGETPWEAALPPGPHMVVLRG